MSWTGINWTIDYPRLVTDVTGDGRADIVGFGLNGVWVSRNDGQGGFLPPERGLDNLGFNQSWRVDRHVRTAGQFGGASRVPQVNTMAVAAAAATNPRPAPSGAAAAARAGSVVLTGGAGALLRVPGVDVVGFGDDGVWIALSRGDGQFETAALVLNNLGYNQAWRVDRHVRLLADLNGDGFSDLVGFGDAGVWTALCTGQPPGTIASIGAVKFVLANFGFNQSWRVDQHPRMMADLTGDRRADIVGFGNDGMWVALGHGDGGFADARLAIGDFGYNQGWRTNVHERLMGDLSGDGKADFVGFGNDGVWTALSHGDGTFAPPRLVLGNLGSNQGWRTDQHPRFLTDLTGDGRADIVGFGNDGVWTALGNGDGTFRDARLVLSGFNLNQGWRVHDHPRFLADITGDGRPDIVGFGDDGVWVAQNRGDGTFADARFVLRDFGFTSGQTAIKHVFVLMLENRSFDHFLGFSQLAGTDTLTGQPTQANGLHGTETNSFNSIPRQVSQDATDHMDPGPAHNFNDVLIQLCGERFNKVEMNGQPYPPVNGTGYAADFGIIVDKNHPEQPMRCFPPNNLRVLNALASEFVVCDHWYSAMPGPTEPNRMFVHAANSDVWDDSPSGWDQFGDEVYGGISFQHGTIFDRLRHANIPFRIYAGDHFPNVAILKGISVYDDIDELEDFEDDINDDDFDAAYTFIEPNYDVTNPFEPQFRDGNSQHPSGSDLAGEKLIKQVYEIIRKSPRWDESMLVITWDEHGGFYDHALPPRAAPTGLRGQTHGFIFDQLGPRVPAVVISPLCPKKMIEHRLLEHSVIPATVEQLHGLSPLTVRDGGIIGLQSLATLQTPRPDTPLTLPDPVAAPAEAAAAPRRDAAQLLSDIHEAALPWLLRRVIKAEVEASPTEAAAIKTRVAALKTVGDLNRYLTEITPIVAAKRAATRQQRLAARRTRPVLPTVGPAANPP